MRIDRTFTVLAIGGSDPLGGAGIQGDLATLAAHGAHGASVVVAVTAQNADGVLAVHRVPADVVEAQVAAVLGQVTPRAIKTGMLLSGEIVAALVRALAGSRAPLVVDPVLAATAGGIPLASPELPAALIERWTPRAALVTPNLEEAAVFLGREIRAGDEPDAARDLRTLLRADVLLKGGHAEGVEAVDHLATGTGVQAFAAARVATVHAHGTGCALATSLAVRLGRGEPLERAVAGAKEYVRRALLEAGPLGTGRGPLRHEVSAEGRGSPRGS